MLNELNSLTKALLEAARNADKNPQPVKATVQVRSEGMAHNVLDAVENAQFDNIVDVMADAMSAAYQRKMRSLKGLND